MESKKDWVASFEYSYLCELLKKNNGNVSKSAEEAKLDRGNFTRLLRKHALKAEKFRKKPKKSTDSFCKLCGKLSCDHERGK